MNSNSIKIFILSFIAIFILVTLRHLGVRPPHLTSPLPQQVNTLDTLMLKLQEKKSSYQLKQQQPLIKKAGAAATLDQARAYIVVDFDNGTILAEKSLNRELPIASLTKVMTAVVALDVANEADLFTVSKRAAQQIPTKIGVVENQQMTLSELLQASLLTSANDAVEVIREEIDSQYGKGTFVNLMNKKAEILGLSNTHFTNPQGFDNPNHYSSVGDLAILSHYAIEKYPLIAEIAKKDYAFLKADNNHKQFDLYNWNGLMGVYPRIQGLKIGNTGDAGMTTIVLSNRNDKKILAIVLGATSIYDRDMWAADLLDIGYEKTLGLTPIAVTAEQLQEKYATWKYWN